MDVADFIPDRYPACTNRRSIAGNLYLNRCELFGFKIKQLKAGPRLHDDFTLSVRSRAHRGPLDIMILEERDLT